MAHRGYEASGERLDKLLDKLTRRVSNSNRNLGPRKKHTAADRSKPVSRTSRQVTLGFSSDLNHSVRFSQDPQATLTNILLI